MSAPVRLGDIGLELGTEDAGPSVPALSFLPERADGTRYARYSDAIRELAAPAVFENRLTYRLTGADLTGPGPRLRFTLGRYFDGIDTGEAAAHEYAATRLGEPPAGLRGSIGDPFDLRRRPADLLTVAVIDGRVFDELFSAAPRRNAEGTVLRARAFTADAIERVVTSEPVQAAGAAVLALAWRHRGMLLAGLTPAI